MTAGDLGMFVTNDLVAVTRGRAFPAADIEDRRRSGVGWVPANLSLTPFGPIANENPFGPLGDVRLMPDADDPGIVIGPLGTAPPLTLFLCDITNTDGSAWGGCPRTLLKGALADLEAAGFGLDASFEHEFMLSGVAGARRIPFSLFDMRAAQPFCGDLVAALGQAGTAPEMILPEYGAGQFEVTVRPTRALAAADRAVLVRDITRDVARLHGVSATFVPIVDPTSVGNGVHVHFSLTAPDGSNVTADLSQPSEVGAAAGSFAAGILKHLPAICAITAPSMISYLRLTPHRWSAGFTAFGHRNREAAVRVCPTVDLPGRDRAKQIHLEFRAADATASPYLVLAILVRAGLEGLRAGLPTPPVCPVDPADLSPEDAQALGIRRLPSSLESALEALAGDPVAVSWLPEPMRSAYFGMKRAEMAMVDGLDPAAMCARYAAIY